MTRAQARLYDIVKRRQPYCEYWPAVNDWVKDAGPTKALALRNINRTVDALIRAGYCHVDDDGYIKLGRPPATTGE